MNIILQLPVFSVSPVKDYCQATNTHLKKSTECAFKALTQKT